MKSISKQARKIDLRTGLHDVYGGDRLRFRLYSSQDFAAFDEAITSKLKDVVWETPKPVQSSADVTLP